MILLRAIAHLTGPKVWFSLWAPLLAACILVSDGERPVRPFRVAYVGTTAASTDVNMTRLLDALKKLPQERTRALQVSYRAVRDEGPVPAAEDLRSFGGPAPDLWVAPTGDAALAVRRVDSHTPMVFATYPDPVRSGLVGNLGSPGGRSTGVWLDDNLHAKRLELLHDGFPSVRSIGVLVDRAWLQVIDVHAHLFAPAAAMGLKIHLFVADRFDELAPALSSGLASRMDAWYVPATYVAYLDEARILTWLKDQGRPAIHSSADEAHAGALMSYWLDTSFAFDALAVLVARIAAGENPADIPVQRPRRHVLSMRVHDIDERLRPKASMIRRADVVD